MPPKRPAPTPERPSATVFRQSAAKRARGGSSSAAAAAAAASSSAAPAAKASPARARPAAPTVAAGKAKASNGRAEAKPKPQGKPQGKPQHAQRAAAAPAAKAPAPSKAAAPRPAAPPKPAPAATPLPPRRPAAAFRILAGSYERHLYGLAVTAAPGATAGQLSLVLTPQFAFPAHPSAITAVAAAEDAKWGASGASEDVVKVWDLRKRKEVGVLQGHTGTITALVFPLRTYLLSASSSGELNLYRTRDWSLLRTLRGHTGPIRAIAPHPGARLALTLGTDAHLRAWDLMRARAAGSTRLPLSRTEMPEDVRWAHDGRSFVVLARGAVLLYDAAMQLKAELRTPRERPRERATCVCFARGRSDAEPALLLAGTEDGVVRVYALPEGEGELREVGKCVGHANRVKAITTQSFSLPQGGSTELCISISTDGKIRVFDLATFLGATGDVAEVSACASHDTRGARLMCLAAVSGDASGQSAEQGADEEVLASSDGEESVGGDESDVQSDDDDELDLDVTLDPAEEAELRELIEQVRAARRKGVRVEGMSDEEEDSDEDGSELEEEDEEEDEGEAE